jgi:hypothetical protein
VDSGNTGLLEHTCCDIGICWWLDFFPALVAAFAGCLGVASSVIRDGCAFHSSVSPELPLAQSTVGHLILASAVPLNLHTIWSNLAKKKEMAVPN